MAKRVTAHEQRDREQFVAAVGKHLQRLRAFIRHELAYFEAVGDLGPGEVTVDDVVDAVMVRADAERRNTPTVRSIRSWLIRLAIDEIDAQVKRSKLERRRVPVHVEQDVPETPPAEWVSTLGDEILDFYEPDEDLKLEDIIPDLEVPDPEEEAERRELQRCAKAALAEMSREQRRALLLRYDDELPLPHVARALHRPEPEAKRILEEATQELRRRLVEAGCRFKAPDV